MLYRLLLSYFIKDIQLGNGLIACEKITKYWNKVSIYFIENCQNFIRLIYHLNFQNLYIIASLQSS